VANCDLHISELLGVGGVFGEGYWPGNRPRARLGKRWQGRGSWYLRSPPDRAALPARFTVRIAPPIRWPQRRLFEKLSAVADDPEVVLAGGNLSRVVRVGDTVRRPTGPWTPMVHDLLRHIRSRGFLFAPEPLGIDQHGREILSFIPGETISSHPWPAWVWDDDLLRYAVLALAAYHRSVADFRPSVVLPASGRQFSVRRKSCATTISLPTTLSSSGGGSRASSTGTSSAPVAHPGIWPSSPGTGAPTLGSHRPPEIAIFDALVGCVSRTASGTTVGPDAVDALAVEDRGCRRTLKKADLGGSGARCHSPGVMCPVDQLRAWSSAVRSSDQGTADRRRRRGMSGR
jgi:hypothetical protein